MTIGKNSRKTSVRRSLRAPKYLDKSSGFYGRLDEPGTVEEVKQNVLEDCSREGGVVSGPTPTVVPNSGADEREETGVFDFNEGMMEDDGESLLQKKPIRHSSRWRRSSRRKQKEGKGEENTDQEERLSLKTENQVDTPVLEDIRVTIVVEMEKLKKMEEENEKGGKGKEPVFVHFPAREDADDQVLIRDKKRGREEEGEEEKKMKKEQEEGMKVVKRTTMRTYRKALDRAFRRGWEAFITNLYSVTLLPVTSSSPPSPSSKRKVQHKSVLAEFQ
ncbi:hypothetical protein EXN66_Car013318 [Channa argus]|uniref:Uncharacterized protein n=1 Tax=Channa argus TaxID=215402 RepID=A0A6G1Q5V1_CHAAH|nr:hypothetical protein EXN66_Car013318 [Channa argus]KAK2900106.1 hypothetical protein Q8A73_013235 [Channa argus]